MNIDIPLPLKVKYNNEDCSLRLASYLQHESIKRMGRYLYRRLLQSLIVKEISPSDLALLLNDFLFDYIDMLIKLQFVDNETYLHKDTRRFVYIIRQLIDILEQSAL